MDQNLDMRNAFIRSAVHIVAHEGMDRATTKNISKVTGLNEAYIYRCFPNKEDLLREAFHLGDLRFLTVLQSTRPIMKDTSLSWEKRCYRLWKTAWDYIMSVPEDCVFYIRYYYSGNYIRNAREEHLAVYKNLPDQVAWAFKDGTAVFTLLRQLFDSMLCFANRVIAGELPNNDGTCDYIFHQVYPFLLPHFKPEHLNERPGEANG